MNEIATAISTETKQFKHLIMCVVEPWGAGLVLPDAFRVEYKKLDNADEANMGDKDIIQTSQMDHTLKAFGLTAEDLTVDKLKQNSDMDVLIMPNEGVSAEIEASLPQNVFLYNYQDNPQEIAAAIAQKTNAYLLAK